MEVSLSEFILNIITSKTFYVPVITIIITILLVKFTNKILKRIINTDQSDIRSKKKNTIVVLLQNIIKYVLYLFAVLIILSVWGINVSGIVTGLGVAGVVGGLALQDALKDIIMGCNIIMDNYFVVGDLVSFNGFTGEVIEFGLKNTKIQNVDGKVLVVANREISQIINVSQKKATVVVKIPVAYEEKIDKVEKVLNKVCEQINELTYSTKNSKYMGIDELNSSSVDYMINAYCLAGNQFVFKRQILRIVKKELDKNNVKIPYPQIEVHNGK